MRSTNSSTLFQLFQLFLWLQLMLLVIPVVLVLATPVNAFVPVFVPVVLPARFVPVAFVPESSVPVNDTNSLGSVNRHCITTSSTA